MLSDDAESESSPARGSNPYFGQAIRRKPAAALGGRQHAGAHSGAQSSASQQAATHDPPSFLSQTPTSTVPTNADVDAAESELRVANSALAIERRLKLKLRDQLTGLADATARTDRELAALESRIVVASAAAAAGPTGQQPRTEGDLLLANMEIDEALRDLEREYAQVTSALNVQMGLAGGPAKRSTRETLNKQTTKIRLTDQAKKAAVLQKQVQDMEGKNKALSDQIIIMKNGKSNAASIPPSGAAADDAARKKDAEASALAQLQDAIAKESKSANQHFTTAEQEAIARTQQRRLELNAAEHLRLAKESEKSELQHMVEAQNKAFAHATQRKAELQKELEDALHAIAAVTKDMTRVDDALESCNNHINRILLQSSEVPMLQERAWQQEKAQLESKIFASNQAAQVLRREKETLQNTLSTLTAQVAEEAALMSEMRSLHFTLEDMRIARESSAKEFAEKLDEAQNNQPSQKQSVIKSLEASVAAVEKHTQLLKESNESLKRKIKGAQTLLTANGLGNI